LRDDIRAALSSLDRIEARLAAVERHLGLPGQESTSDPEAPEDSR